MGQRYASEVDPSLLRIAEAIGKRFALRTPRYAMELESLAMESAYLAAANYRPDRGLTLKAWVAYVARSRCKAFFQSAFFTRWRGVSTEGADDRDRSMPLVKMASYVNDVSVYGEAMRMERINAVRRAIESLDDFHREMAQYMLAGYQIDVIAKQMGISVGMVNARKPAIYTLIKAAIQGKKIDVAKVRLTRTMNGVWTKLPPLHKQIWAALKDANLTNRELAEVLKRNLNTIRREIRKMHDAGLVEPVNRQIPITVEIVWRRVEK